MDVLMMILGAALALTYLYLCGRQKKPIKVMLINSGLGIASLVLSALLTGFSGSGIAVNLVTVLISAVLGIPGAIMIAAMGLWL